MLRPQEAAKAQSIASVKCSEEDLSTEGYKEYALLGIFHILGNE